MDIYISVTGGGLAKREEFSLISGGSCLSEIMAALPNGKNGGGLKKPGTGEMLDLNTPVSSLGFMHGREFRSHLEFVPAANANSAAATATTTSAIDYDKTNVCDYTGMERERFRARLARHYHKHNPENADANIEKALALKITERNIFKKVVEKYGTDPKVEEAESRELGLLPGMDPKSERKSEGGGRQQNNNSPTPTMPLPPSANAAGWRPAPTLGATATTNNNHNRTTTTTAPTIAATSPSSHHASAVTSPSLTQSSSSSSCTKCPQLQKDRANLESMLGTANKKVAQLELDKAVLMEQLLEVQQSMVALAQQCGVQLPRDLV